MRNRFLNLTIALGLVIGLMAGVVGSASADATSSTAGTANHWIYYPWVPNNDTATDGGPWYGTITVQNIEEYRVIITVYDLADATSQTTTLEPGASKTLSAATMGLSEPGSAVAVESSWALDPDGNPYPAAGLDSNTRFWHFFHSICQPETTNATVTRSGTDQGGNPIVTDAIGKTIPTDAVNSTEITYKVGDTTYTVNPNDYYIENNNTVHWTTNPATFVPPISPGDTYKVTWVKDYNNCRAPMIAGVEKHVSATPSFSAKTTAAHMSVDGYTAIPMQDVAWGPGSTICHDIYGGSDCVDFGDYFLGIPDFGTFDGQSYLPIAQTNNGWNTILHISLVDPSAPDLTSVTVTFYTAASQGAFGPSVGSFTTLLNPGETWTLDLTADADIPAGWVGDVWITSDYGVVAIANRQKATTGMALTNQSAPSLLATTSPSAGGGPSFSTSASGLYTMVAPLIFKDYNGWNMGISVANVSELTNNVQIQLVGPTGNNVGGSSMTIPAKAMEFWYVGASQDLNLTTGFVGAAILSSYLPFHAAVDEVKYSYTGTGQDVGQAMSYIATDAGISAEECAMADPGSRHCEMRDSYGRLHPTGLAPELAIPLIQKGDPNTGMGDMSGIQLFNASQDQGSTVHMQFQMPSGALAAPTLSAPYELALGPHETATLYTADPQFSEMSNNFQGSAIIWPVEGAGDVFGVSNNVNYAVQYDGSAVYNAINSWGQYRMLCSQQGIVDSNGDPIRRQNCLSLIDWNYYGMN